MRLTILPGVLLLLAGQALAQSQSDVSEILKKVGATYGAVKEYEIISTSTGTAVPGQLLLAFRAPDRYRMEGEDPNTDALDGTFEPVVLVHDGSSLWLYRPKANVFATFTKTELRDDLKPESMDDVALGRFRGAAGLFAGAKLLREETTEIAGSRVDCFVLSTSISAPMQGTSIYTWWVDKKSNHVVREDHKGSSVVYTTIKLNEPLPDDLFRFVPPAGARKLGEK